MTWHPSKVRLEVHRISGPVEEASQCVAHCGADTPMLRGREAMEAAVPTQISGFICSFDWSYTKLYYRLEYTSIIYFRKQLITIYYWTTIHHFKPCQNNCAATILCLREEAVTYKIVQIVCEFGQAFSAGLGKHLSWKDWLMATWRHQWPGAIVSPCFPSAWGICSWTFQFGIKFHLIQEILCHPHEKCGIETHRNAQVMAHL